MTASFLRISQIKLVFLEESDTFTAFLRVSKIVEID
jgi:hypothetical protein